MKYQSSLILKHLECHKGLLMNHRFESKGDHNDYSILLEPKIIDCQGANAAQQLQNWPEIMKMYHILDII